MKKARLALFAALMLAATGTFAQSMTAGDLRKICIAADAENKATCRFYILGITQGMMVGLSISEGKSQAARPCIPDLPASAFELLVKAGIGQDLMIFPDDAKLEASGVVAAIIAKKYPCKK